jgi:hypothetical protein
VWPVISSVPDQGISGLVPQLNRLDWYNAHGWSVPYPGDTKILTPSQVPGANLPADYLGD